MIQAEYEMQQVRNKVQLTLDQLLRLQKSVGQQVTIAQQSREFAQENLQLAEKAFRLGESDLTTLLRMRAAAFNAESLLDRQRLNQATVISRLNQALGALP
jgi:outer membrane protein TolC